MQIHQQTQRDNVMIQFLICFLKKHEKAATAKSLQSCPTLRPQRQQPTRHPHPWDSPGKNTGVGCHFLLQYMKVKSESEVPQSCPTLSDPIDCSLPGSSVHGIFQARVLELYAQYLWKLYTNWKTRPPQREEPQSSNLDSPSPKRIP